jgi:hypothetical protein
MLNVFMLNVFKLNVFMLKVVMLNAIMLNLFMLTVMHVFNCFVECRLGECCSVNIMTPYDLLNSPLLILILCTTCAYCLKFYLS